MMSSSKPVQLNIRLPNEAASDLDILAGEEHASRVDVARQILQDGIDRKKKALALRLYHEGRASKSRAAKIAGVSLWEMMDLIDGAAIPSGYTLQQAVEDVRDLVARLRTLGKSA
ncbi:MAG: UPF0175 family protein [Acidobacteriota bacterium]